MAGTFSLFCNSATSGPGSGVTCRIGAGTVSSYYGSILGGDVK